MNERELAMRIVEENEEAIKECLMENRFMFDDEFNQGLTRPVARMIPEAIMEKFGLDDCYVNRMEHLVAGEYRGIIWMGDEETEFTINVLEELLETRYQK